MTIHQVTCVRRAPTGDGTHSHITHLGLGTSAGYYRLLSVAEAILQLRSPWGDRYYTISPTTGRWAGVVEGGCERCSQRPYVRTSADGLYDNNLGTLPSCAF